MRVSQGDATDGPRTNAEIDRNTRKHERQHDNTDTVGPALEGGVVQNGARR